MGYNWQLPDWANFTYDAAVTDPLVINFALETGELKGLLDSLPETIQQETILQFMIAEAVKTSEIEGEFFSRQDIMSSLKKRLGIADGVTHIKDKKSQGIAHLMVEVRKSYKEELTESLLKNWHHTLMKNNAYINAGRYRKGKETMQIVSGSIGREIIHFQAPPSNSVAREMKNFICWYNEFHVSRTDLKGILIKTATAHLYFESIHPFEDGNGRIGRAIAEKCLSQSLGRPVLMSLSSTIEKDRKQYYNARKAAQQTLEITEWISYFAGVILESQKNAKQIVLFTINKAKFLDQYRSQMNERQFKAILKMFDFGSFGFEGGMTSKKYISITQASRATATRDLQDLADKKIFMQTGEGRSVRYELNFG
ncbi:MAG: Fic family protein [Niabella sp.]|nr:Fic family protein [Niabella sp.]